MTIETLQRAVDEAVEFLVRANPVLVSAKYAKRVADENWHGGTREHGALKRQSLELSEALVRLRKP
jgi:hypothetical protein